MSQHVIVAGNPLNGFAIFGPFATGNDAVDWADNRSCMDTDWWVTDLESPGPEPTYEQQWVETTDQANPRLLSFDEVEALGLDGTLRS